MKTNHDDSSMPEKLKKQPRQMTFWESDDCKVPVTTGNSARGKAVRPTRESSQTSTTLNGGTSVNERLDRITTRAKGDTAAKFNNVFTLLNPRTAVPCFSTAQTQGTGCRWCHALADLGQIITRERVNFVYDADISGFFDNVNHRKLVELLGHRIEDARMLRLITKFLKSGVMIQDARHDTTDGVAQGSVLSPLLASDAKRFADVLVKRLGRYSLELAVAKTKLIRFGRFARRDCQRLGEGAPGTFDFLGFMHYCGTSRSGKFKLKRRTATKKFRTKVADLQEWFRTKLTTPISEVWPSLVSKLQGHFHYFHVNDNWQMLMKYREAARRLGIRWMRRRSQKGANLSWARYRSYLETYPLPMPGRLTDLIAMTRAQ